MKRGFTLIELLVVIAIIAILASILFPVFAKARAKARQATCTSQVRQIATAVQMYAQDNQGQYPGVDGGSWVSKLASYLGNSDKMFMCPEDTAGNSGRTSYAFAGVLIRADGSGVKEANVLSPSEVGCVADATPSEVYPSGRLIGGGALMDDPAIAAAPASRHSKGTIAGYADGHAKYIPGTFVDNDMANEIARGFYQVASLGLVDNPVGCLPAGSALGGSVGSATGAVVLGGEYATYPLLSAAGAMYGGGNVFTRGFNGASYNAGRPTDGSWVWGGTGGVGGDVTTLSPYTAIAYDAICVIVAKGSKIPATLSDSGNPGLGTYTNETYIVQTVTIGDLFSRGFQQGTVQVYRLNDSFSTTGAIKSALGWTGNFGGESITVANDLEMVDKVANDPYAIGYCSTVFADPSRVTILALRSLGTDGQDAIWPRSSKKFRWVMPSAAESTWPWKRALTAEIQPSTTGTGAFLKNNLESGAGTAFMTNLRVGPLFKMGYWPGRP